MFKLADLFVNIGANTGDLDKTLKHTQSTLGKIASTPITLGGLGVAAGAAALAYGVKKAVDIAGSLNESLEKTGVIFGQSSSIITDEADHLAKKFGVVKKEYIDAAANFGAVFKQVGYSQKDAAEMGNTLTKLGMDMASLDEASNPEVFTALGAALRGEFDPLERFRVFLNADKIAARAMAMGLAESKTEVSDLAKRQATLSLIFEQTSDAQGNLEQTSGSYSNQVKEMHGRLQALAEQIGTEMLPAFTSLITIVNDTLQTFSSDFGQIKAILTSFSGFIGETIGTIGVMYRNWGLIVERTGVMIGGSWVNLQETLAWLGSSIKAFLGWFAGNWQSIFADAFNGTITALSNLGKNFSDFFSSLWDTISSWGEKPFEFKMTPIFEGHENQTTPLTLPELNLSSVADELAAIDDQMVAVEQKHADAVAANAAAEDGKEAKKKAALAAGAMPGKKAKEKSAEFVGLEDFAKRIQSGALDKDRTAKDHLAVSREALELQRQIARNTKKPQPALAG